MDQMNYPPVEPVEPMPNPFLPRQARGYPLIAWLVILLTVGGMLVLAQLAPEPLDESGEDKIGLALVKMQGRLIVGAAGFTPAGDRDQLFDSIEQLNIGTIPQRFRVVILSAELIGPEEASDRLTDLIDLIETEQEASSDALMTEDQQEVLDVLRKLYPSRLTQKDTELLDRIDALSQAERDALTQQLDWFGELALYPEGSPPQQRDQVMQPATRTMFVIFGVGALALLFGIGGFIGLIVFIVLLASRKLKGGLQTPGRAHHGLYAETFAVWLVLFLALQIVAGLVGLTYPSAALMLSSAMFFISMAALAWPIIRGASWSDVRHDIGLYSGRAGIAEPIFGVFGYAMALPMLGVGLLMTLALMALQALMTGAQDFETFSPTGGPAHPIVEQISAGGWWLNVQIILLAAVAAPIVEETFFRGVLYRHLRDISDRVGVVLSTIISGVVSGFVFAVIHPQGWVAIPVLMSLAFGFVLVREWRRSLIAAIVVHGMSNFIVMSMLMLILS